ncbi:MAG: cobaltochelatase subunit CobN, partial [Rhizobacter sp.]|nr:cobaltochelatase subunit CobN [Chlorobiales bacterium]
MTAAKRLTLVLGMESYNTTLFDSLQHRFSTACPAVHLSIFYDTDCLERPDVLADAIKQSDAVFTALMVIDDSAEVLVKLIKQHQPPVVFAYESLPSVMKLNHVGSYQFSEKSEMPKPVKRIAQLVAGGREEDAFYGFVQIQKMTNRVMKFLPESFGGEKFKDVRIWMTASTYWTNSGEENIFNMLLYIAKQLWASPASPQPVQEFNTMGFFHPEHYEQTKEFFPDLKSYQKWEKKTKRDDKSRAKVGVLFSRKHLLCGQTYASDVVRALESKGLRVYACYVLGIELHIAARTWMKEIGVDALINLFGFPLVGGPAGSTKAGIANPAAQEILSDLNVPYIVAQPLFTQSKESWDEQGINPMQQMMMYSLPEMDGAIAPVVLGAIHQSKLQSETGRLDRLAGLVKQWTSLRQKKNSEKKLALVLYNYPPGTGHLGTAALLNVPASVFKLMRELKSAGYNVGDFFERTDNDEKKFLSLLQSSMSVDSNPLTATVKEYTEWLLPAERQRIEARWGKAPGDVASLGSDRLIIGGLTFGNIYIGSQPNLYIVGDPMRLLFDKENTPHHQYAAFYRWLEHKFAADALVHVGMHGTAEWMPGQQIGMTDTCWSDI